MKNRHVFISYGREDSDELAQRLSDDLKKQGHQVSMDVELVQAGVSWESQIEDMINDCDVFVALLTPHAVRRPMGVCLDEISMARFTERHIVPCMVINCRPPLCIYRLDYVDFKDWQQEAPYKKGYDRLVEAIENPLQRVEGIHAAIFSALKPLDFGIDIARLIREFTGRQWMMDRLEDWLASEGKKGRGGSRLFLITGDPGTGKSALASRLVQRHPKVVAYHFCVASLDDSLDPSRFVYSIASQLSTQLPDYREALAALDLFQVSEWDASTQFRRLIADPLHAESSKEPILCVVDALDESLRYGSGNICRVLADRLEDLPPWVRIVATSRPQPEVLDILSRFKPQKLSARENLQDIFTYIDQRLCVLVNGREGVDTEELLQILVDKAEGNFLYAVQVVEAIRTGLMDPAKPESFPTGLVSIYRSFFERFFPELHDFESVRPILDIIVAAREHLDAERLAKVLGEEPFDIEKRLQQVASFFPLRGNRYVPYHKSLTDWLRGDVGHDLTYRIDVNGGHQKLADYLLKQFKSKQWDEFVLAHLIPHLVTSRRWEDVQDVTTHVPFLKKKAESLGWNKVQKDIKQILESMPEEEIPGWLEIARQAISDQIEDLNERFVWYRVVSYYLLEAGWEKESIAFDLQGGRVTDQLFEETLNKGKVFDALVYAENSCWVYGRSSLHEQCADISRRGQEASSRLEAGPVRELIELEFLKVRASQERHLKNDKEAEVLFEELRERLTKLAWELEPDQLQSLEEDTGPFPSTPSSHSLPDDNPLKVQLVSNAYDALNALYLTGFLEEKGARVDWFHHSDTPDLAPQGYALSIIMGGPLSPGMFLYNLEFKDQSGFMDLYRVDLPAYDVFKLTKNSTLCCLIAGSTKFLTTMASHKLTTDPDILARLEKPGG